MLASRCAQRSPDQQAWGGPCPGSSRDKRHQRRQWWLRWERERHDADVDGQHPRSRTRSALTVVAAALAVVVRDPVTVLVPGLYIILHPAVLQSGLELDSEEIKNLGRDGIIEVAEVRRAVHAGKWRGRVVQPQAGWISLENTQTWHRWVTPAVSLPTVFTPPSKKLRAALLRLKQSEGWIALEPTVFLKGTDIEPVLGTDNWICSLASTPPDLMHSSQNGNPRVHASINPNLSNKPRPELERGVAGSRRGRACPAALSAAPTNPCRHDSKVEGAVGRGASSFR